MKDYQTQNIRNIAIVGHGGEGKTTLTEALLWTTGAIDRMGRVEDGNTVSDYDTEEIRRQFSISTSVAPVEWKDKKINFIDIPGYFDFIGEMMGPLRIVDAALIVVGAVNGLNVGAEKAMAYTSKHSIPRAIFINSMDRENADYDKVIQQLGEKYQTAICPVMLPIYENDAFIGFSSLVTGKSYRYLDKFSKEVETTPEMRERIEAVWAQVDARMGEVLADAPALQEFLNFMSQCRNSLPNQLLLSGQNADITDARTFQQWKDAGRHIRTGEEGYTAIVGQVYENNGRKASGYNIGKVFDITQTRGRPIPATPRSRRPRRRAERLRPTSRAAARPQPASVKSSAATSRARFLRFLSPRAMRSLPVSFSLRSIRLKRARSSMPRRKSLSRRSAPLQRRRTR